MRPMEMILAGTGGCSAFDVVLILKKGRHAVSGCEVSLNAERAETDPKVFTRIHFHYRVKGRNLKRDAVARAIELSKDKYCSASIMMAQTAELTYDFEIVEEA
jgi:putative redox protein